MGKKSKEGREREKERRRSMPCLRAAARAADELAAALEAVPALHACLAHTTELANHDCAAMAVLLGSALEALHAEQQRLQHGHDLLMKLCSCIPDGPSLVALAEQLRDSTLPAALERAQLALVHADSRAGRRLAAHVADAYRRADRLLSKRLCAARRHFHSYLASCSRH